MDCNLLIITFFVQTSDLQVAEDSDSVLPNKGNKNP